ncbi:MAG: LytR family transcriptional regulator [Arachnia propionica]|nr:MAG: LytR family transcriptional regulator [Arachnia propionica]
MPTQPAAPPQPSSTLAAWPSPQGTQPPVPPQPPMPPRPPVPPVPPPRPMPVMPQPMPQTPPPGRPRRPGRSVLRVIGTLLIAWIVFLVGVPIYAWLTSNAVDTTPASRELADQPGRVTLLVGSDSRENLSAEDQSRLGTGSIEGRRTDTMLLLYQPPTGPVTLISLPRDSYLEIPGHGKSKLNAAYAWGGAPLLIETIELNTGVKIDDYLEVGFLGVVDLVDAVGGVEVCPEKPMQDRDSHLDIPAGCQQLDGVTALAYVRMRKADPRGDLGRMERQREIIHKVATATLSPLTFINPLRYWSINGAASKSLTHSTETGPIEAAQTALGFVKFATGGGISVTVPVADANARTPAGSSMIWDKEEAQRLFTAVATGDTETLATFSN